MLWLIFDTETSGLPPKHKLLNLETVNETKASISFFEDAIKGELQ